MKHEFSNAKQPFENAYAATPRAIALAVVLASAATMLLNAAVNLGHDAPLPTNAIAPTRSLPIAPDMRPPEAIPTRNITHAEAKL